MTTDSERKPRTSDRGVVTEIIRLALAIACIPASILVLAAIAQQIGLAP